MGWPSPRWVGSLGCCGHRTVPTWNGEGGRWCGALLHEVPTVRTHWWCPPACRTTACRCEVVRWYGGRSEREAMTQHQQHTRPSSPPRPQGSTSKQTHYEQNTPVCKTPGPHDSTGSSGSSSSKHLPPPCSPTSSAARPAPPAAWMPPARSAAAASAPAPLPPAPCSAGAPPAAAPRPCRRLVPAGWLRPLHPSGPWPARSRRRGAGAAPPGPAHRRPVAAPPRTCKAEVARGAGCWWRGALATARQPTAVRAQASGIRLIS